LVGSPWQLSGLVLRLPLSKGASPDIACCGSKGSATITGELTNWAGCGACCWPPPGPVKSPSLEHPMSLADSRLSFLAFEISWLNLEGDSSILSGLRTSQTFLIRLSTCLRLSELIYILRE
jgi:hypothetical protein